jgi:hypothetical protein
MNGMAKLHDKVTVKRQISTQRGVKPELQTVQAVVQKREEMMMISGHQIAQVIVPKRKEVLALMMRLG